MLKQISIMLLIALLFPGCSSKEKNTNFDVNTNKNYITQKQQPTNETPASKQPEEKKIKLHLKPPLTDEMKAELVEIFSKNLTDEEKEMLMRDIDVLGVKLDMTDVETQLVLICSSPMIYTNTNLKTELGNFFERYSYNAPHYDNNRLLQEIMNEKLSNHGNTADKETEKTGIVSKTVEKESGNVGLSANDIAQAIHDIQTNKRNLMVDLKSIEHVEVRPGEFIEYHCINTVIDPNLEKWLPYNITKNRQERTELVIPWGENEIHWKGVDVPVSIRAYQDTLYMIGYDRETDREKTRYRYYKQIENQFHEIEPDAYPKSIVTQNRWFHGNTEWIDMAIKLDPQAPSFCHTATARIWYQLMTGKEYYEFRRIGLSEIIKVAEEYVAKYQPIKLTKIVYEGGTE